MIRSAYIGILSEGTTSRMRAEVLRELRPSWDWQWIDTDAPMKNGSRLGRSIAFRLKCGPVVSAINHLVCGEIDGGPYDLVWIDKGVFLQHSTLSKLRDQAARLIHYTPDTAFHTNRSRLFEQSMPYYDLLVTTKSFEVDAYRQRLGGNDKLFLTTQGFDKRLHRPVTLDHPRRREVAFVGLAEPDRFACVEVLLEAGIGVHVGGMGWENFAREKQANKYFHYLGSRVFGEDYARLYSSVWIGLGLLSKRFPELHTTRTLEIPACGAILATERTDDTERLFQQDDVLFFKKPQELAQSIIEWFGTKSDEELQRVADSGRQRVEQDGRDYCGIIDSILNDVRIELPYQMEAKK